MKHCSFHIAIAVKLHFDTTLYVRNTAEDVTVTIAGEDCAISSLSDTEIICTTSPRSPSTKAKVEVEVAGNGIAKQVGRKVEYIYKTELQNR